MRTKSIGDLRQRVTLEQASRVDDGGGGADETWVSLAVLWASIEPLGGGEDVVADVIDGSVTHEIWIRYRDGVQPAMRFNHGGRIFEILRVIDVEERHRWLRMFCFEQRL